MAEQVRKIHFLLYQQNHCTFAVGELPCGKTLPAFSAEETQGYKEF
jgi:hypothetical protein